MRKRRVSLFGVDRGDAESLSVGAADRRADGRAPGAGLALAIVQGGEVAYANGFGVTSAEDGGVAVTPQTLFRIGSTTKPLTGTAVMRLVERGLLDLDRPVTAYLPWLRFSEAGVAERVTLRMLLSHTAGLPREQITPHLLFGRRDPAGLEAYVREELPRLPLVAPPGVVWSYSNPGINLAGYLAEVVSGRPYAGVAGRKRSSRRWGWGGQPSTRRWR